MKSCRPLSLTCLLAVLLLVSGCHSGRIPCPESTKTRIGVFSMFAGNKSPDQETGAASAVVKGKRDKNGLLKRKKYKNLGHPKGKKLGKNHRRPYI